MTSTRPTVQRVKTSNVIAPPPVSMPRPMPITEFYSVPSGCPNCVQHYR